MSKNMIVNIDRRRFLKSSATVGAGLTLSVYFPGAFAEETSAPGKTREMLSAGSFEPNAFLRIGTDNQITIFIKHLEMGQGTFTGLSTLVAEELDANWEQIHPEHAAADATRYKNLFWGIQGTGGSSSTANSFEQMRKAGAAARYMLLAAAAQKWQVPVSELTTEKGVVSHVGSDQQASYGELAELAAQQVVPEEVVLKDPKDYVYIGKKVQRKDTGKTDGSAVFTQDINLPDMLTALVAHPPKFGATVKPYDAGEAKKLSGVVDVVQIRNGIAVLAKDFWTAKKGRDLLKIDWDESQAFKLGSDEIMAQYKEQAKGDGLTARQDGDVATAFSAAEQVLEASYEFPYLAHAAMEPMNCVVQIHDGEHGERCEIWNGAQLHTGDQYAVGALLGIEHTSVKINTVFAGGSFGRRGNKDSDYVVEAAMIAQAYKKAHNKSIPIKLVWTREDDTQAGYYRPAYYHSLKAGLDKDGNLTAWHQHVVGQSIMSNTAFADDRLKKEGIDNTSIEGAVNLPYAIPNFTLKLTSPDLAVPVLWWRAVGSTHTAFAAESFIDKLAAAANKDPVEFRLAMLKDHPRHRGVLELAAEKAGWGTSVPKGQGGRKGRGVAVHESFKSYVALVADVTVNGDGTYRVDRIVCAVDCGIAVNPDIIRAQMEGGIAFGLSATMVSEITLDEGRVVQSNFHDYQVLRLNQMPEIEVHIVPPAEPPTGVGEPGTPVVAPAVANALSAATGQRFDKLPLKLTA